MNDRLPGSSYDNPIRYGKYRIYLATPYMLGFEYEYIHDDYDGAPDANDHRYGLARTVEQAKELIDELEAK